MVQVAAAILVALSSGAHSQRLSPFAPATAFGAAIAATDLGDPALRIQALVQAIPREYPARGVLAFTRRAFAEPWLLPELGARLSTTAAEAARPARCAAVLAARAMATAQPSEEGQGTLQISDPQRAIYALDFLLNEPNHIVREALARASAADLTSDRVAAVLANAFGSTKRAEANVQDHLVVLGMASALDRHALVSVLAHWDVSLACAGEWTTFEAEEIPAEIAGAFEGTVLTAQQVPELGWLVVGGVGPNTYDMSRVAAVFDPGGDDVYLWNGTVAGSRAIVDVAGNDTYKQAGGAASGGGVSGGASNGAGAPAFGGPGGALLGASLVVDLAGDDRYACDALGMGAAAFGVALLVDSAGNDTYTGEQWCAGAALGGIGALVDLAGEDLYDAPVLSQGVGGPSGLGMLIDAAGNDRYRADRTRSSMYGMPATFAAFSQGCAFGYRSGAPGGVGLLMDCAGNDRYECGEFGQGCGYYLGFGILNDSGGDDVYLGNRYSQGAAAHQAFGLLRDMGGNDLYHGVTAANQGAAWDMSVAMLVDAAGDDTYIGAGLSQGAAAQQALGVLVDMQGDDRYRAEAASQGAADSNRYHWVATLCPSLGVLWDFSGRNAFAGSSRNDALGSPARSDGERLRTGTDAPPEGIEGRTQWGLFFTRE